MDIFVGNNSFNAEILKSISKEEAVKNFFPIKKEVIEMAWNEANPKRARKRPPKKAKK